MSQADIISINISANGRGVSRKSFGIPLVAAYHTKWLDRYKIYSSATALADMITDGFAASDPAYIAVQGLVQASPKVPNVVVGRLVTAFEQLGTLTVVTGSVEVGKIYSLNVVSPAGVATSVSYTALAGDAEADVATALAALITAITGITATSALGVISWEADNTGEMWRFTGFEASSLSFEDTTLDSSLTAELVLIKTAYPDFYGLTLADAPSDARNLVIAAATEAEERIFGALTYNTNNASSSTGNLGAALKALDYFRTFPIYSDYQLGHAAARWMGGMFPLDAGSASWAYKSLSGVSVNVLNPTETANLESNNVNYYISLSDLPLTFWGTMASGEWIDVIRGRDWLVARLRERLINLLANNPKLPYTEGGALAVKSSVKAQMEEGITQGYLSDDPDAEPIVTTPVIAEAAAADKVARVLRNVSFQAVLAGAIHKMVLDGTISVGGVA